MTWQSLKGSRITRIQSGRVQRDFSATVEMTGCGLFELCLEVGNGITFLPAGASPSLCKGAFMWIIRLKPHITREGGTIGDGRVG